MAAPKTPGDISEFMKLFDPANMTKMFDPQAMMDTMGIKTEGFDPTEAMEKAKEQFEAMAKSNEAVAASYRTLIEKQNEIFRDVTAEAAQHLKAATPAEAAEAYQTAFKRSFEIMTELSDAARVANEQAFETVKGQVEQAINDLKPKG